MLCCTSIGIPGVCTNNCIIIPLVPALLHSFNFTFFRVMIFFVPHSNQLRSYQRNPYKNCCCLKCARQEKEINRFSPTLFFQQVLLFNNFCFVFFLQALQMDWTDSLKDGSHTIDEQGNRVLGQEVEEDPETLLQLLQRDTRWSPKRGRRLRWRRPALWARLYCRWSSKVPVNQRAVPWR